MRKRALHVHVVRVYGRLIDLLTLLGYYAIYNKQSLLFVDFGNYDISYKSIVTGDLTVFC